MVRKNGTNKKQSKPRHPIDDIDARDILRRFVIRARRVEAHSLVQNHAVEKYVKPSMKVFGSAHEAMHPWVRTGLSRQSISFD